MYLRFGCHQGLDGFPKIYMTGLGYPKVEGQMLTRARKGRWWSVHEAATRECRCDLLRQIPRECQERPDRPYFAQLLSRSKLSLPHSPPLSPTQHLLFGLTFLPSCGCRSITLHPSQRRRISYNTAVLQGRNGLIGLNATFNNRRDLQSSVSILDELQRTRPGLTSVHLGQNQTSPRILDCHI